jgi:hypothetical protein
MKLELKHLAPYLPYGLKIRNIEVGKTRTLIHEHELPTESAIRRNVSIKMLLLTNHINKPILRPLSDLTKEIEVNGEVFIPIIKLFNLLDSSDYVDYRGNFDIPKTQIDDGWNHCLSYGDVLKSELCFSYGNNSFLLMVDDEVALVSNQLYLINKLFEYHFDVFGLIEKGLAIDINTLKL